MKTSRSIGPRCGAVSARVWIRRATAGAFAVIVCAGGAMAQGSEPRLLIPSPGGPNYAEPYGTPPTAPTSPGSSITGSGLPGAATPGVVPPAPSPITARLEVRMSQLEQDLRAVTGRLEDVSYQLRKLDDRLDKLASDVEYRLSQVKTGDAGAAGTDSPRSETAAPGPVAAGGGAVAATPRVVPPAAETDAGKAKPPTPAPTQTASVPSSPRDQYARAFAAMEKRNYDDAASGFAAFLKANPDDPLADNARYWLGETYYARAEYARAAEVFLDGYEKNKTGPKAPDTLLKLGLSLAGLDKKKEACASFRELNRAFPNAPATLRERATQEGKRLACP